MARAGTRSLSTYGTPNYQRVGWIWILVLRVVRLLLCTKPMPNLALEALAFLCLFILPPNLWLMVALFSVVGAGTCAVVPCLWNFPTLLPSDSATIAAIGLMNTFGSVGGVIGPYAIGYLYSRTHSFSSGLSCLMLACLMAASLVLFCPVSRFEAARTACVS